ncbi:MAG: hypothetical protein IKO07_10265 [Clostridia bacterium]|nr:hypothetical protein [Clostridia bacterium]
MRELLLAHAARYPLMEATDFAKLIYQSAFAGGHLIASREAALSRLKDEMASLEDGVPAPLTEPIGGGLCRLYLAPARRKGLRAETICGLFAETAASYRPDPARFEAGMDLLEALCREGALTADPDEIIALRRAARESDYAPFSHSPRYREAYKPAYRLAGEDFCRYLDLFAAIDGLLESKGRARVAIDGRCASGKTTAAALIARVYGAQLFHMDDYFLPFERKTPERLAQPGGNVDWERFRVEVLDHMDEESFAYRPYNCFTGALDEPAVTRRRPVQLVEGAYSLHPAMAGDYDLRVMMDIDTALQRERIRRRNPDKYDRFVNEWIPMENHYLAAFGIEATCDIILRA